MLKLFFSSVNLFLPKVMKNQIKKIVEIISPTYIIFKITF